MIILFVLLQNQAYVDLLFYDLQFGLVHVSGVKGLDRITELFVHSLQELVPELKSV